MSDWIRPLFRAAGASGEWHLRTNSATTTTSCGQDLAGPIEVAREDKAKHEGRCAKCVPRSTAAPDRAVPQGPPRPTARAGRALKEGAAKKPAQKPTAKKRSSKAPAPKRSVRRSRRGRG